MMIILASGCLSMFCARVMLIAEFSYFACQPITHQGPADTHVVLPCCGAGQAQLLAIAQSIPSAFIVFLACALPVAAYARLRAGWLETWFSAAAFVLLSLELTMVRLCGVM